MIIKSLGRKIGQGAGGMSRVFGKLIRYMNRGIEEENGKAVLWHELDGGEYLNEQELQAEFERNARYLKKHSRGNVLYHEILSFSAEYLKHIERGSNDANRGAAMRDLEERVTQIGQEYIQRRAPKQMAYGVIHRDTDHLHLHLLISANQVEQSKREWLTKAEFAEVQKSIEAYVLQKHPELGQSLIYGKDRQAERIKTQAHEQAMNARTGGKSRKEQLTSNLHQLFELAGSHQELEARAKALGATFYTRGQSIGVIVREEDGKERRHRLRALGLQEHYYATQERWNTGKTQQADKEQDMETTGRTKGGGFVWGQRPDTAPEIVMEEFATGKLHEAWHGQKEPEQPYTDDILKRVQEQALQREAQKTPSTHPAKAPPQRSSRPSPDRGDDLER